MIRVGWTRDRCSIDRLSAITLDILQYITLQSCTHDCY